MKTKPTPAAARKKTTTRVVRPRRAAKPKTTTARRAYVRRKKIEVPPLLLEGDQPAPPPASGPGRKYALGPVPPSQHFETAETELPEAYGTKKLFLTARDPHWLYAHWDLTREQQLKLNARSAAGHLILRIYAGKVRRPSDLRNSRSSGIAPLVRAR